MSETNSMDQTKSGATVPMINIHNLWKKYGRIEVLKGIDLQVPQGTVTCLIGQADPASPRYCGV